MSTGGFIGFRFGGTVKGTYNHFDSYPSELGNNVVEFIRGVINDDRLGELVYKLKRVDMVDAASTPTGEQVVKYSKFSNIGVGTQKLTDWYVLLRETQGIETIKCIMNDSLKHMIDNTAFLTDTVMCEYGYVLNFDEMSIEFYDLGVIVDSLTFESLANDEMYAGTKWIDYVYGE